MKRLIILMVLINLTFHVSAQTNYAEGKRNLDKADIRLNDYQHLKILFDSVKVRFANRFFSIFPKPDFPQKAPFNFKNDGCEPIADSFMEFAGSFKFDSSGKLKRVPFGKGYVCSFVNIDNDRIVTTLFEFTDHRVVKFKLINNDEYVFDMVISQDEPMKLQTWITKYRDFSNDQALKYTEVTLTQSIKENDYSVSAAEVRGKIKLIMKMETEFNKLKKSLQKSNINNKK